MEGPRDRCKSADFIDFEDDSPLDKATVARSARSLESGLDELTKFDVISHTNLKDDKDFVISELRRECSSQEAEILRLRAIEASYVQAKQQLKDTKWMLKVKEEELKNVKSDCANNYNKRLEELVTRLNEKDVKLTTALNENQELMTSVTEYSLRADQLEEQVDYLQREMLGKNKHVTMLEKQLTDLKNDKSRKSSTMTNPNLESFLEDDDNNYDRGGKSELNTTSTQVNNTKEEELLQQVAALQQELLSMQAETSLLRGDLTGRDVKIREMEEQNGKHIEALQLEIEKEKHNVNELVRLLEGLSTNSDQLPTGQVERTVNAPLEDYLLRRCTSTDSVHSVEELQDDKISIISGHSEFGTSFEQQMSLTVERYEKQINQLQQLYDQDVFALEKDKGTLTLQMKKLKEQCATANSSSQITTKKAEELEKDYQEKINRIETGYQKKLEEGKNSSLRDMSALKEETDRLNKIIQSNEMEYTTMRDTILSRSHSVAQDKMQDIVDFQQQQVVEMQTELKDSLQKIQEDYDKELLSLEQNARHRSRESKTQLEDNFSDHMLNMHEVKNNLELKVSSLVAELDSTQTEYDLLKGRYDNTLNRLDEVELENRSLNESLLNKSRANLLSPVSDRDPDVFSISSNDIEIDSENYVNIDCMTTASSDQNLAPEDQLKQLRCNLNEAKNEVTTLKEENVKFEILSENLNKELNDLKEQLQNQSVFDLTKQREKEETLRFLETSMHNILSCSGMNLSTCNKQSHSALYSYHDTDGDVGEAENVIFHDPIGSSNIVNDSMFGDLANISVLSRDCSSEDVKELFEQIKLLIDHAKDERRILYRQLVYLNTKFATTNSDNNSAIQEGEFMVSSSGKSSLDVIKGELFEISVKDDSDESGEPAITITFEDLQEALFQLAREWHTHVVGTLKISNEAPTQGGGGEAPESAKKDTLEASIELIKQEFKHNLSTAKEQMANSNEMSLAVLREDLEADHNGMMKILEETLQKGYQNSIDSLTEAHEQELSHFKAIEEKEKNSLRNRLTGSERNTEILQQQHQQLQSNYEQVFQTLQEVQEDLRNTTWKLDDHVSVNSLKTAHVEELLDQLKELQQLNSYNQDETSALKQLLHEKDEDINTLKSQLEDHVTHNNNAATPQRRQQRKTSQDDVILKDHATKSNDDSNNVDSSQRQVESLKDDVNSKDHVIKSIDGKRNGLKYEIETLIKIYENTTAKDTLSHREEVSNRKNVPLKTYQRASEFAFLLEQNTVEVDSPSQDYGLDDGPFGRSLDTSVNNSQTEDPIDNFITSNQASSCLKALHHAFQNYHESEMQQLKQASSVWLTKKVDEVEQKSTDLRVHDETLHINRLAEIITRYVINTAILIERHRLDVENEVAVNLIADDFVSQALSNSLNELIHPTDDKDEGLLRKEDSHSVTEAVEPIQFAASDHVFNDTVSPQKQLSDTKVHQQLLDEFVMERFDADKSDIPSPASISMTEATPPHQLVDHIKTQQIEMEKLRQALAELTEKQKSPESTSTNNGNQERLSVAPTASAKLSGLKVRIQENTTDSMLQKQLSNAKDDICKQYQNLLNEFVMEQFEELKELKTDKIGELEEHAKELAIIGDEHNKEIETLKESHELQTRAVNEQYANEIKILRTRLDEQNAKEVVDFQNRILSSTEDEKFKLKNEFTTKLQIQQKEYEDQQRLLKKEFEAEIETLNLKINEVSNVLKAESQASVESWKQRYDQQQLQEMQEKTLQIKTQYEQEILQLKAQYEQEILQLKGEVKVCRENAAVLGDDQLLQQNKTIQEKDAEIVSLQTQLERILMEDRKKTPMQVDEDVVEVIQVCDVQAAPVEFTYDFDISRNDDLIGDETETRKDNAMQLPDEVIETNSMSGETNEMGNVPEMKMTKALLNGIVNGIKERDLIQSKEDICTLMICETLGVVLSAEQLIDDALTDVITSQALEKGNDEKKLADNADLTIEQNTESNTNNDNDELNEVERMKEQVDHVFRNEEELKIQLMPSLKDSCKELHEAIEHILNMFMNAVTEQREMQTEYENLATKYSALVEHASQCESDNKELVIALKNSANDQGALEQTLDDSSVLINSYEDAVRKLQIQIKKLEAQTSDENKDETDGNVVSNDNQKRETSMEKDDATEKSDISENGSIVDLTNDQLAGNNDDITKDDTLPSKDEQIKSLKQDVESLSKECDQAKSYSSKLQEEAKQYEKLVDEITNKSNNLYEEREYLLRDKQEKSLQLAELKNLLAQEHYKQEEVVEKAANDSLELNDANTSLLGEIESLNEALGRLEEERKVLTSALARTGYSLEDIPKVLEQNVAFMRQVSDLKAQVFTLQQALNELLAGKQTADRADENYQRMETTFATDDQFSNVDQTLQKQESVSGDVSVNQTTINRTSPNVDADLVNKDNTTTDKERPATDLRSDQMVYIGSDDALTPTITPRYSLPNTPRGNTLPLEEMLCKILEEQLSMRNKTSAGTSQNAQLLDQINPKILLGEIQEDANELLQLVLNYPEFYEPLTLMRTFQNKQKEWLQEKRAMLDVIKSWEDMVSKMKTSEGRRESPDLHDTHERRRSVIDALQDLFEKENALKQISIESVNSALLSGAADDIDDDAVDGRPHDGDAFQTLFDDVQIQANVIAKLDEKDREYLIAEITTLHNTLRHHTLKHEDLTQDNQELQRAIELMRQQIEETNDRYAGMPGKLEQRDREVAMLTELYEKANEHCDQLKKAMNAQTDKNQQLTDAAMNYESKLSSMMRELEKRAKDTSNAIDNQNALEAEKQVLLEKAQQNLQAETDKLNYLQQKLDIVVEENKSLSRLLEKDRNRQSISALSIDDQMASENIDLLESLNKERESKQEVQRMLEDAMATLEKERGDAEVTKKEFELANENAHLLKSLHKERESKQEVERMLEDAMATLEKERAGNESMKKEFAIASKNTDLLKSLNKERESKQEVERMLEDAMATLEKERRNAEVMKKEFELASKNTDLLKSLNKERESKQEVERMLEDVVATLETERKGTLDMKKDLELKESELVILKPLQDQLKNLNSEVEKEKSEKNGMQLLLDDMKKLLEIEKQQNMALLEKQVDVNFDEDEIMELRKLLTKLNNEIDEYEEREKQWLLQKRQIEDSISPLRDLVESEKQKHRYTEEKMKLLHDQLDGANTLLEFEKKCRNVAEDRNEQLMQYSKKVNKELDDMKNEKDELESALRDINQIHEEEREKLQKMIIASVDNETEKVKERANERTLDVFQQNETNSLRTLLSKLNEEVEDYQDREKQWNNEKKYLTEQINMLRNSNAASKEESDNKKSLSTSVVAGDGRKLTEAGWTIAKVQRLYLKYLRAERFQRGLRYQKRYLTLYIRELEATQFPDAVGYAMAPLIGGGNYKPKSKFKIVVLVVIAINRMKYLVRKYQRYLLKSSPRYQYKEKQRGSSSSSRNHPATSARNSSPNNGTELSADDAPSLPKSLTKEFNMPDFSTSRIYMEKTRDEENIDRDMEKPSVVTPSVVTGKFSSERNRTPSSKPSENRYAENTRLSSMISENNDSRPFYLNEIQGDEPSRHSIADSTRIAHAMKGSSPEKKHPTQARYSSLSHNVPSNSPNQARHKSLPSNASADIYSKHLDFPQRPTYTSYGQEKDRQPTATNNFTQSPTHHQRSFDSIRSSIQPETDNTKPVSSPPKSYPRAKSSAFNDNEEEDLIPTRLKSSTTSHEHSMHRRPITVDFGSSTKGYAPKQPTGSSSQQDLKGYMQKLEDLQRRLKSQTADSRK